jgi:hypothetical protein
MIRIVDLRPNGLFAFICTAEIDGVTVRLDLRWWDRMALWALVMLDPDGVPLAIQQVVRPGGLVLKDPRSEATPAAEMVWNGPDPYARDELGAALRLLYA